MNVVRTIVLVLIVALGLNGWAAQAQALDLVSSEILSALESSAKSDAEDCSETSVSQGHHDHSSPSDGADYCQMVSQALVLDSASADGPGWAIRAGVRPAHPDALTGISIPLSLRPPRA